MNEIIKVENMIYEINGKQVMLDSDLALLYNVETKRINEAVKNNINKFPERFSWKLNDNESKIFLDENFDQKIETRGGRYKNPRVFTEQGVAMLATILKSKVATEVSIRIMDAFSLLKNILKEANESIIIIDNYLDTEILDVIMIVMWMLEYVLLVIIKQKYKNIIINIIIWQL